MSLKRVDQKVSVSDTVTVIQALCEASLLARQNSYSPYSKFKVGAALLCSNNVTNLTITGCNVENASFGLSVCAERVALFAAIAQGKRPVALGVSCRDALEDSPVASRMPCGACRQVMLELLPADAEIHIDGVGVRRLEQLLPCGFELG